MKAYQLSLYGDFCLYCPSTPLCSATKSPMQCMHEIKIDEQFFTFQTIGVLYHSPLQNWLYQTVNSHAVFPYQC